MMEVQEICRKLKPILGAKAERYWLAYLAEDYIGKREIEIVLNLLAAKHLAGDVEEKRVHLSVPPRVAAAGEYPIGMVTYNGKAFHPFGIRESEWIQHAAIFGRSGAGKTNTVFIIIENILNRKKPFLIFDWKRNYRDLLAVRDDEILVYTVGRDVAPFSFNPLIPPDGTDGATWLKKLIEIIAHSYYLGEGVMFLLQEALHSVYRDFGVYGGRPEKYPTFEDVLKWLENYPAKGRKALWMDSALRGVKSMCFGHMGEVVNTAKQPNIEALLEKNVILELDSLTNADKSLITESLLLWIHHYRMCQHERETLKHFILIEEAHHILLKKTGAGQGGEAITDTILREIRELGEAIVLVDQHPSLISVPTMGNTYTTIAMNVKHLSDVNALGGAMLLADEERDLIGRLPVGEAIIKMQGRWLEPFLIRIPHRRIVKGAVSDAILIQKMNGQNILSVQAPEETKEMSEMEVRFLVDVLKNPLAGAVERYRNLSLSRRQGNAIRETLVQKQLIEAVELPTFSGKTVLAELTEKGRQKLRDVGQDVPRKERWGSPEHEYWKMKVAEQFQRDGWNVVVESPTNGFTDVVASRGEERIAIEIETGKSDWRANLEKNLRKGFRNILIVATRPDAAEKITGTIGTLPDGVRVWVKQAQMLVK